MGIVHMRHPHRRQMAKAEKKMPAGKKILVVMDGDVLMLLQDFPESTNKRSCFVLVQLEIKDPAT